MNKWQAMLQRNIAFMPDWMAGIALVALAILCALFVHRVGSALVKRAIGPRRSLWVLIVEATSGPTRLALCLAAVAFVVPAAPLNSELRSDLAHLFVVATVALVGWISIRAVDLASAQYLLRYHDFAENLLVRKHVTQVHVFKRVIDTLIIIIAPPPAPPVSSSVLLLGRC